MLKGFTLLTFVLTSMLLCQAGEMYKYKDAQGNWVFSDKPPEKEQTFETLKYSQAKKPTAKIKLYNVKGDAGYTLFAKNDFYTPVEVGFTSPLNQEKIRKVIPARGRIALFESNTKAPKLNYRWALGEPKTMLDRQQYLVPFDSPKPHRVTQGFNGKFSHQDEYNKYAVDIAMDVGTYLTAVRAGTVVWVKDDYHMSGTTRYFLDKANSIKILHDDGTFAQYAHILMDTALVNEGDKVQAGDRIARSGSSGFSTGPHLHFSIVKNAGLKNVAIPFQFIDENGRPFTPKRAMTMVGIAKPK